MKSFVKQIFVLVIKATLRFKFLKIKLLSSYKKSTQPTNRIIRIFGQVFFSEIYPHLTLSERMDTQLYLMGGDIGVAWAEHYQTMTSTFPPKKDTVFIGDKEWHEVKPFVKYIEDLLSNCENCLVIQIGSSSGREIAYFSKKFQQHYFIGTDIVEEVCDYSSKKYSAKNIKFINCPSHYSHLLSIMDNFENYIVFSSGSLQYAFPEHLNDMFKEWSKKRNVHIIVSEPSSTKKQIPTEIKGSTVRGQCSYTHNYSYYARKNGFNIKEEDLIKPYISEKYKNKRSTCGYFGVYSNQSVMSVN